MRVDAHVASMGKVHLSDFIKSVYRSVPPRVRKEIKKAVLKYRKLRGLVRNRYESSERSRIWMSPDDVGTTYNEADVLPMLALENKALHDRLHSMRKDLRILKDANEQRKQNSDVESIEEENRSAKLAEEYLQGQPIGRIRHLVIANEYPRYGKEYGNGFIHQRVKHYLAAGVAVDVVCAGFSVDQDLYEFDGVRVLTGRGPEIAEVLARQDYRSVSVHFMNQLIWQAIEPHMEKLNVHVFLHGYECSRWIRRIDNYANGTALERAIDRSIDLQLFWREILEHRFQPQSYIFVSNWWRRAVLDDMLLMFPPSRTHIVHNYVNSELFSYEPKDDAQRFKLLWIRPAASRNYGSDIAIDILNRLSESDYWSKAEVLIIGDGLHFPQFERELGHFPNVRIEQRFATQEEIAALHKEYGVFLVPTRLDSQGVSRDEARSSGLVAVTNLVAATPEFIDAETGIVAGPESADQLARGILEIWKDPQLFQKISKAGAQRVRQQTELEMTVGREMALMGLTEGTNVG